MNTTGMIPIYIITPTWNSSEDFRNCCQSVLTRTIRKDYTWIVVDNGSCPDELLKTVSSIAWMRTMQGILIGEVVLLQNKKNLGIPVAQNRALDWIAEHADGPYGVVLLDADTTVETGWLEKLTMYASEHLDVGVVGGSKSPTSVPCPVYHHPNGRWYVHDTSWSSGFHEAESVDFACAYWPPWITERGLRFDEGYEIYGGYDPDLCFRVRSWGYRIMQIDAGVLHYASSVMKRRNYEWDGGGKAEWDRLRERNNKRFKETWGQWLAPYRDTISKEQAHMATMNRRLVEEAGKRKAVPERG